MTSIEEVLVQELDQILEPKDSLIFVTLNENLFQLSVSHYLKEIVQIASRQAVKLQGEYSEGSKPIFRKLDMSDASPSNPFEVSKVIEIWAGEGAKSFLFGAVLKSQKDDCIGIFTGGDEFEFKTEDDLIDLARDNLAVFGSMTLRYDLFQSAVQATPPNS